MKQIKSEKVTFADGKQKYREFDMRGNEIFEHDITKNYKVWRDYDDNDNVIHAKDNTGYEYWAEYDEDGEMIFRKDSAGFSYQNKQQYKYDENGKLLYRRSKTGKDYYWEYDHKGNQVFSKGNGIETSTKFDDENRKIYIHQKRDGGIIKETFIAYLEDFTEKRILMGGKEKEITRTNNYGNVIYSNINGFETFYDYTYHNEG